MVSFVNKGNSAQWASGNGRAAVGVATSPRHLSPQELFIIDTLCGRARELEAISTQVQTAIQTDNLREVALLRDDFRKVRDQIVAEVQRLAHHA